ncbi:hypothetical protein EVAR_21025_1 [Eumeta japonica]|uniref:Uncharacterized protein n=1 Tax=Eumeta variegata TaxID=151549 RepID=A0A4C1V160_EUMVA|nr:hypothetical protein EVAR_21025_1 [Eumeta japonica]
MCLFVHLTFQKKKNLAENVSRWRENRRFRSSNQPNAPWLRSIASGFRSAKVKGRSSKEQKESAINKSEKMDTLVGSKSFQTFLFPTQTYRVQEPANLVKSVDGEWAFLFNEIR